jgi:adhesin transport system membrane fusion protein
MICDVEIVTGKKTILSYLLKPLIRARSEALNER